MSMRLPAGFEARASYPTQPISRPLTSSQTVPSTTRSAATAAESCVLSPRRRGVTQLVERIEFARRQVKAGCIYRIGVNGARIDVGTVAADVGLGKPGYKWRPHSEPHLTPPSSS